MPDESFVGHYRIGDGLMAYLNKEKEKAHRAAYYEANKERIKLANTEYRRTHSKELQAYSAAYYAANAEKILIKKAEYQAKNADKIKAAKALYRKTHADYLRRKNTKYREQNTDKVKKYMAEYYTQNIGKIRELGLIYRDSRREIIREKARKRYKENKDKSKIYGHNYRARKKANGGKLSFDIIDKLFALQRGKCAICKSNLKKTGHHIDHIYPISLGGKNEDRNVQLTCPRCNLIKKDKDPIKFMQEQGYLL